MEAISGRKTIQEIAADHAIGMRDAAHLSVRPDPGEPVEAAVARGRQRAVHQGLEEQGQGGGTGQGGRAVPADRATADGAGVAQQKVSAALMPVNCASWSTTTTTIPSSALAANVRCWGCPGRRSTTDPHRCWNRPCGSWPGSMLSIWKTHAVAAAGWWTTWRVMGSRSAVTGGDTSCAAWG